MAKEIRWYKGKWKVHIIQKSNVGVKGKHLIRNMEVEALEELEVNGLYGWSRLLFKGDRFTTIPRLLWRHKRG